MENAWAELFGWLFAFLLFIIIGVIYLRRGRKNGERQHDTEVAHVAQQQGLHLVRERELPSITKRVHSLLQPPMYGDVLAEKAGPVLFFRVGGRDTFLYEWVYQTLTSAGRDTLEQVAYIVLGPGAPYLRATPKRLFAEPSDPIEFPEDPDFSKTFWVEGPDKAAIRRYLGPEFRQFLLTLGRGRRFHAGPEGVALARLPHLTGHHQAGFRASTDEVYEARTILERLAALAEAAGRR